jgi:hypothetical protein
VTGGQNMTQLLIKLIIIVCAAALYSDAEVVSVKYDRYIYMKDYSISERFYSDKIEVAQERNYYNPYRIVIDGTIPDGKVTITDIEGRYRGFKNYKNGVLDGEYKTYFENGRVEWEKFYVAGRLEGVTKSYTSFGKLSTTSTYINGERVVGPVEKTARVCRKVLEKLSIPFILIGMAMFGQ